LTAQLRLLTEKDEPMKRLMLAGAAAVALLSAPALGQEATSPPTETETTTETPAPSGQLTVEGVTPAEALGAIDPSKLTGDSAVAEASEPAATDQQASTAGDGQLTVQGVTPAQALGALDPTKLTGEGTEVASADTSAVEPVSEDASATVAEATAETQPDEGLVQVAEVSVPLPSEVAEVVEDGSYSTEDLVAAQLAAIMDAGDQTAQAEPQAEAVSPG